MDFGILAQLGVGGTVVVATLFYVDRIIGKWATIQGHAKSGHIEQATAPAGLMPVAYWQREGSAAVQEALDLKVVPVLEKQTELLERQNELMNRFATLLEVREARDEERNRTH
jgi:hypothetical protein